MSYAKIAGATFPVVCVVLALFVVMHLRQVDDCPAPPTPAAPVAPPAPTLGAPSSGSDTKATFEAVYKEAKWGTGSGSAGTSGSGSTLAATLLYRTYLQQFLAENHITSVVDAGCGDWEFSQAIDWKGIDYKGYDIVDSVIDADKKKYGADHVQFFQANIIDADLPPADLLVVKHVLQHLPNADVAKFLAKQVPKYKHVLIINSVNANTYSAHNVDITNAQVAEGGVRNLDVTAPPFNLPGDKPLSYWNNGHMHQIVHHQNN